jgi:hypothetical protein
MTETEEPRLPGSGQQSEMQTEKPTNDSAVGQVPTGPQVGAPETQPVGPGPAEKVEPQPQAPSSPNQTISATNSTLTNVDQVGGDKITITEGGGKSATPVEVSSETRLFIRVLTLVIGVAGLVGGVIWLLKAIPGFTLEFLIPLVIVIAAVVLGVMGILNPDQIVAILTGQRGADKK